MKRILVQVAISILALFTGQIGNGYAQENEIRLGVLTELSGQFASNGNDCRAGHSAALKAFSNNGNVGKYKIKLIYGDSKGEGKAAVSEMNKLLAQDSVIAILANRSQVVMPLNPISRARKVPLLGVAAHPDLISENEYAFRFYPSTQFEGPMLAKKMIEHGAKKVAALGLQDEYLVALQKSTTEELKKLGATVVYDETVTDNELDFNTLISRIAAKQPDYLLINFGLGQSGVVIRKIRERGLKQPIVSNFWIQKEDVIKNAGKENMEGAGSIGIAATLPKFGEALQEFAPGARSSTIYYACHVALASFLHAVKNSPVDVKDSTSALQALQNLKKVELLDETLPVKDREVQFTLEYSTIRDGQIHPEP